jgi:hypothetical protein
MLRLALLLYLPLLALVLIAPRLAAGEPLPPVLEGFVRNCDTRRHPCWFGLQPGLTSSIQALAVTDMGAEADVIQEAAAQVIVLPPPHPDLCRVLIRLEGDVVVSIVLRFCPGSRLPVGWVIDLLGPPERLHESSPEIQYGDFPLPSYSAASPFAPVRLIRLAPPVAFPTEWYGFLPRWRYCQQIVRQVSGCSR